MAGPRTGVSVDRRISAIASAADLAICPVSIAASAAAKNVLKFIDEPSPRKRCARDQSPAPSLSAHSEGEIFVRAVGQVPPTPERDCGKDDGERDRNQDSPHLRYLLSIRGRRHAPRVVVNNFLIAGRAFRAAGAAMTLRYQETTATAWRKGWDSNPRYPCRHAGFQDRCLKPLGHPSSFGIQGLSKAVRRGKG